MGGDSDSDDGIDGFQLLELMNVVNQTVGILALGRIFNAMMEHLALSHCGHSAGTSRTRSASIENVLLLVLMAIQPPALK